MPSSEGGSSPRRYEPCRRPGGSRAAFRDRCRRMTRANARPGPRTYRGVHGGDRRSAEGRAPHHTSISTPRVPQPEPTSCTRSLEGARLWTIDGRAKPIPRGGMIGQKLPSDSRRSETGLGPSPRAEPPGRPQDASHRRTAEGVHFGRFRGRGDANARGNGRLLIARALRLDGGILET